MSDRLREALEQFDTLTPPEVWPSNSFIPPIVDAARRFLALTETGPDYERADAAFRVALATKGVEVEGLPTAQVSRAIVDAALADYLTEDTR